MSVLNPATHQNAGETVCEWKGYTIKVSADYHYNTPTSAPIYDVFNADGTVAAQWYFELGTAKAMCTRLAKATAKKFKYAENL